MKIYTAILVFLILILNACGGSDEQSAQNVSEENDIAESTIEETVDSAVSQDLLRIIAKDPKNFQHEFKKMDTAQKYYFCAAFAMGAMSVAKPATASAMVNYFLGMGVVQYNRGIDDETYKAFDFGKNIFHFEPVVNTILHEQICESIIGEATSTVKHKHLSTKDINKIGKKEVRKIVQYIKENK